MYIYGSIITTNEFWPIVILFYLCLNSYLFCTRCNAELIHIKQEEVFSNITILFRFDNIEA